jgi:hypothetical protein
VLNHCQGSSGFPRQSDIAEHGRPSPTVVTFVVTKNPARIVKGGWRRYEEKDIRSIGVPVSLMPAGDVCSAAQKRRIAVKPKEWLMLLRGWLGGTSQPTRYTVLWRISFAKQRGRRC